MPQPLECLIIGRITTQSPVVVDAVRIAQELGHIHRPAYVIGLRAETCQPDHQRSLTRQAGAGACDARTKSLSGRSSATDDDLDLCSWIGGLVARVVWCARARR